MTRRFLISGFAIVGLALTGLSDRAATAQGQAQRPVLAPPSAPATTDDDLRAILTAFERALGGGDYETAARLLSDDTLDYFGFVRTAAYRSQRGVIERAELGAAADILMLRGCLLGQYRTDITDAQLMEELYLCGLLDARMQADLILRFRQTGDSAQVMLSRAGVEEPVPIDLFRLVHEGGRWRIDLSNMHRTQAIEIRKGAERQGVPDRPVSQLYDYAHDLVVREWRRRGRSDLIELWTPLAAR